MEMRKKTQKIAKKMAPKFQIFAEGTYMRLRNRPERPPSKLSTRNGANTESRDAIERNPHFQKKKFRRTDQLAIGTPKLTISEYENYFLIARG